MFQRHAREPQNADFANKWVLPTRGLTEALERDIPWRDKEGAEMVEGADRMA
jgi:hypothetical protein